MTTQLPHHLAELGDVLERATAADLAAARTRRRPRRYSRRMLVALAAVVVGVPAAALAASALLTTPAQVAAGLPAANRWLEGTDPTCTVVTANVEYHCVLASQPRVVLANPTSGSAPAGASSYATVPFREVAGRDRGPASVKGVHDIVRIKLRDGTSCIAHAHAKLTLVRAKLTCTRHGARVTLQPAQAWSVSGMTAIGATSATGATGASTNDDWTATVEPTVDATKHVNGGCRAQNAAGTEWECYIGEAAVAQNIISQGFLGQYAPVPGVG